MLVFHHGFRGSVTWILGFEVSEGQTLVVDCKPYVPQDAFGYVGLDLRSILLFCDFKVFN